MTSPETPSTILVVEDDPIIREVTGNALSDAGYRVVLAGDGEEALAVLSNVMPDLILSDIRMPRCDGFELLRRFRRMPNYQTTPFIIMSAKAENADQRTGMSLGADDYVTKPFAPEDLLKTIEVRLKRMALVNRRLSQQQQFLTRVIPHELRTPLTGIIGYSDLMMIAGEAGEPLAANDLLDYGRNIGRSGQRLLHIAEDFSLWSWLESMTIERKASRWSGLTKAEITVEAVRSWCEECVSGFGRSSDFTVEGETAIAMVPEQGLGPVIAHLVSNGLKFSLPGSAVHVKIMKSAQACEIQVADGGRGMNDAELEQVGVMRQFHRDRFEQQGTGMGLALARSFAELAGGGLTLTNNIPGPGLTACLKLLTAEG